MRALALAVVLFGAAAWAEKWEVDTGHSSARFAVRHLTVADVNGTLGDVTGTVELDAADLARSSVEVRIDARALDTRNLKRDAHLRSKDFFDVRKFPALTFKSTKVEKDGDGLKVTGELTIRGVTQTVELQAKVSEPVVNPFDKEVTRGVKATAVLKRSAFGLSWNAAVEKGFVVDDEVRVTIDAELRRRAG
jgi:polyisoprenoid-binding protein YceI